eukprot:scaffold3587_cov109-Isochrysis_galbana.AAC.3
MSAPRCCASRPTCSIRGADGNGRASLAQALATRGTAPVPRENAHPRFPAQRTPSPLPPCASAAAAPPTRRHRSDQPHLHQSHERFCRYRRVASMPPRRRHWL